MIRESHDRLRRWQEEVARDPGADAFAPLADLYRAQGRLDVARRVASRGLERNPNHVEGHYVLGRVHRDADEPERAYDEWDIALGLDPSHLPSRRAIGFLCLERGERAEAERHLRRALELDPDDPRIRRALERIGRGGEAGEVGTSYWQGARGVLGSLAEPFVRESRVRLLLLVDPSGRVVWQHGFDAEVDLAGFATLAAGIQSASGELARLLGETGFRQLYQGRGEHQIFLGELHVSPGRLLLLAVFGAESTVGLVRALFGELAERGSTVTWPGAGAARSGGEDLDADLARAISRGGAA